MSLVGLTKFCGRMDLPPPITAKADIDQVKHFKTQTEATADEHMCNAAERLRSRAAEEKPKNMHITNDGITVVGCSNS